MAPAATSLINKEAVQQNFSRLNFQLFRSSFCVSLPAATIQQCASIVTTEVSQVPLSGVLELLTSAR